VLISILQVGKEKKKTYLKAPVFNNIISLSLSLSLVPALDENQAGKCEEQRGKREEVP
jgi:hypothetical protein